MDAFTRWVHLLAVAVYLGATLAVALVFLPAMEAVEDAALQRRLLARGLRLYNVLSVGALGVLVISGASGLTDMKAMMGPAFGQLVWRLVGKLSLTFVLINVATYFSFGLAHPLAADSLVKLPFATTEPTSRPLLGLTIFKSIATDPVRRALVFSRVGLAIATPAPVTAAGLFPAIAPAMPRAAPRPPSEPPVLDPVASAISLNSVTEPRMTNGPTSRWLFFTRLPGLLLFSR